MSADTDLDVLCIGSSVVDLPLRPVDRSVFDAVSYPVDDISMRVGGDALNESIILSRLGARVQLVTAVGADAAGDYILSTARSEGVDVARARVREDLVTSLNVGLVQSDGERTFITNRNGSLWKTVEGDLEIDPLPDARVLAFGSIFNNPLIGGKFLEDLFAKAKAQGMTVVADMVPSRIGQTLDDIAGALAGLDYFFPNADEAIALTGARDEREAAETLRAVGVDHVVMKSGRNGCLVLWRDHAERVPAFDRSDLEQLDTTGAGDNFAAGYIRALLDGADPLQAAVYGHGVAAVSVSGLGATAAVTGPDVVEEFIKSRQQEKEAVNAHR